ncbi:MAG: hypothetical protein GYB65_08130 [Chloroflexi bacterium]|nr:hypothetical protein [Chloroflexota bacterium]
MSVGLTVREYAVNVHTAVSAEECLERLTESWAEHRRALLKLDGPHFTLDLYGSRVWRRFASSWLWILRFEGVLIPAAGGTVVQGQVTPNLVLDRGAGIAAVTVALLSIFNIALFSRTAARDWTFYFFAVAALGTLAIGSWWMYNRYRARVLREMEHIMAWTREKLYIPPEPEPYSGEL